MELRSERSKTEDVGMVQGLCLEVMTFYSSLVVVLRYFGRCFDPPKKQDVLGACGILSTVYLLCPRVQMFLLGARVRKDFRKHLSRISRMYRTDYHTTFIISGSMRFDKSVHERNERIIELSSWIPSKDPVRSWIVWLHLGDLARMEQGPKIWRNPNSWQTTTVRLFHLSRTGYTFAQFESVSCFKAFDLQTPRGVDENRPSPMQVD